MIVVISLEINVNQKFLLKDSILSYLNVKALVKKMFCFSPWPATPIPISIWGPKHVSGLEYNQRPGCKVGVTKSKGMVAVGAFLWLVVCAPGRLGRNRSSSFAIPRAALLSIVSKYVCSSTEVVVEERTKNEVGMADCPKNSSGADGRE